MGLSKFKHLNSLLNLTFNLKSVFSICAGELREESVAIVCFSSDLRKKKKDVYPDDTYYDFNKVKSQVHAFWHSCTYFLFLAKHFPSQVSYFHTAAFSISLCSNYTDLKPDRLTGTCT